MVNKKIAVIGVGNMASAIITGVLEKECVPADKIFLYDVCSEKCRALSDMGCNTCLSLDDACRDAEICLIAVKPQNISELLPELSARLPQSCVVVSIAAGVSLEKIESFLHGHPVVRVMPNACMTVQCGASAISCSSLVNESQLEDIKSVFGCCGLVEFIDEELQNSVISVHSSSPAFIFLFAKAVADEAEAEGISREAAINLFCSTLIGSARMIENSGKSLDELMAMITSKGGTTAAALSVFEQRGFYQSVRDAMAACRDRAEELGKK